MDSSLPNNLNDSIKGRGAAGNLKNRFEKAGYAADPDPQPEVIFDEELAAGERAEDALGRRLPLTQYIPDHTRTIVATNASPDIPFSASINPYRGCSHGCIYCYARPTHEYLGMSPGLDFETKILVKHDAPELLRAELSSKKWVPRMVACSGVTDCYQPIERKLKLTRRCLEVLLDFRNPVGIVTKNALVARDLDILQQLAAFDCVGVFFSVTTLDPGLTRIMEPRTSVPRDRLKAMKELADAGVPVGVMVAPVVPGITDHEMPAILEAAKEAGAGSAGFVPLRLPFAVKDLFADWLERHFPERKNKVLNRIRELRGGALNDPNAHTRMRGEGIWAEHIARQFEIHTARLGLNKRDLNFSAEHFRVPARPVKEGDQLGLFGNE